MLKDKKVLMESRKKEKICKKTKRTFYIIYLSIYLSIYLFACGVCLGIRVCVWEKKERRQHTFSGRKKTMRLKEG